MKVAIPSENGQVCAHFGHAPQFSIFEVDPDKGTVQSQQVVASPPHQPGLLPTWLAEQGVNVVLAGGMGGRAQNLLAQSGIKVVVGVTSGTTTDAATAYAQGQLASGDNICDHSGCNH